MDLLSVLEHTLLPDQKVLDDAQQVLEQAAQSDLHGFLTSLSGILNNIANSNAGRTQAGLQLKNPLYLNDSGINAGYQQRWLSLPEEVRGRVKTIILASLGTEPISPSTAAQCVAYIACAELPSGLWPNLIALLVINVTNQNTTEELKEASLEAIGYICQDIDQAVLQSKSNEILTAILHGMRQEQPSNRVRVAAAKALWNSLEYLKANFDKETERHFIMQVVCEATKSPDTKVKGAALQCLVKIASLYYKQMDSYMGPALTSITMEAMKSDVDEIAFQGIEFWSNVCEKEIALATGLSEAAEQGMPSERGSRFYIQGASMYLCPILLQTLTKQDDVDNDEWSIGRAAGVCLRLIATERKDNIVPLISPFVIGNISDGNWRYRVAAVMALGSILEGPDPEMLQPIVRHVMPMLIQLLNDLNIIGRITTAQIMRRICKIVPKPIITGHQVLPSFLSALMNGLTAGPTVASQFCWTISSLAEAAYVSASPEGDPSTYCLSTSFATIVENLIQVTDRSDGNQHNLRNAAFEALTEMIKNSPKDCYGIVQKTAIGVLEKLDRLLHMKNKIQVPTDRAQYNELQFLICDTLQSVLKKLTRQDALRISDQVMGVLLRMFTTGVQEDALLTVSTLVEVLGGNFANYVDAFKPSLIASLKNSEEHSVCLAAIGLVRNLCQALGRMMSPYCDEIMLLLENLWNSNLHRSVKPHLLSVFGEIALAIGPDFKKFLTKVMTILHQASQEKVEKTDLDMIDYLNDIRQGCLEAYTGIVQCFREGGKLDDVYLLLPYISQIMSFIENVAMDEDHSMENISACCGLIADLCTVLGVRMLPYVDKGTIQGLVTKGLNSSTKRVRNVAMWATQEINKLKSISW